MTRTKKIYGIRLNEPIPNWRDRHGRGGGKIIKLIPLDYCNNIQVLISNGDILTCEYILKKPIHHPMKKEMQRNQHI